MADRWNVCEVRRDPIKTGSAAPALSVVLNDTYLELIDLGLKFPVGEYRDGIVRAAQHVLAKANTCYG